MNTTRWAAVLILLLLATGPARANVAVPLYKSDSNYQRAKLAQRIALPVILTSVALVLYFGAGRDRSFGVKLVSQIFALAGLLALGIAATSDLIVFEDDLQPNSFARGLREPGVGESPVTSEETALQFLIVSAAVLFGGLAAVRLIARQSRTGDAAAATPEQKPD